MSLDPGIATGRTDIARLAAAARSILACPADIHLTIDGFDDVATEAAPAQLQDVDGQPHFICPADSAIAQAAAEARGAVLTLRSGLGDDGSAERDAALTLSGRLRTAGLENCACCDQPQVRVSLDLDFAALIRTAQHQQARVRVPLADFVSPAHDLNRGFLQRSLEHANLCHQEELRRAIATRTNTRLAEVLGAQLADLRADGVLLQWVDTTGSHQADLVFARSARNAHQLGELLRTQLHAGLC
ncbi:MAG: hypothetical protein L0H31_10530 [Nocardioidaceae bacterium]|nr:hypothetical protein [Nocardioidaceae bacterium]